MKNVLISAIVLLALSTPAFAFNYSYDTYSTDSGSLILNSLGDQVTNSHYGALGSNDFISENAYKNQLALDGYTVAYDYNPQNTNPQFYADYNTPLPNGGAGLTELQFAGFEGNPRAIQDVYVSTAEYNALSAQGQANSISSLNTVTQVQQQEITNNANYISTVNQVQSNWNQTQDNEIAGLQGTQQSQQNQINGLNNRVGKLERTQDIVGGQLRLFDSRKWQVNAFLDYTTTRATVQEVGVRFTYKLGKSYEETRIDELTKKINQLLGVKDTEERESKIKVYHTQDGLGMKEQF